MKCYLCYENIIKGIHVTIVKKEMTLCKSCSDDLLNQIDHLEHKANKWKEQQIRAWIRKQKSVKQFYNQQHKLPNMDGG